LAIDNFELTTTLPSSTTGVAFVEPTFAGLIYQENFAGNTEWNLAAYPQNSGSTAGYVIGVPNYEQFYQCGDYAPCLGTNLNNNGGYGSFQRVFAASPAIDISSVPNTQMNISFLITFRFAGSADGANLMYSTDNVTWSVLGSSTDGGQNWYNSASIAQLGKAASSVSIFPNAPVPGWSSATAQTTWVLAYHLLPNLYGKTTLYLRFNLGTDGSGNDFGIGIDDLKIAQSTLPTGTTILTTKGPSTTTASTASTASKASTASTTTAKGGITTEQKEATTTKTAINAINSLAINSISNIYLISCLIIVLLIIHQL